MGKVSFSGTNIATRGYWILIDTGAVLSVIPHGIWQHIHYVPLGKAQFQGFHPGPQCIIPAQVAWVGMVLYDQSSCTPPLKILAYLIPKDFKGVPLILGMSGLLEKGQLEINLPKQLAQFHYEKRNLNQ